MDNRILKAITWKHSGKMLGIHSLSTSNLDNKFCEKMKAVDGSICQKCFADKQLRCRPTNRNKFRDNDFLKYTKLKKGDIPFINSAYFRFESFGELETMIQLENYIQIAKNNKHANFALFTKRADLLKKLKSKPSNMQIVLSSPLINKPVNADNIKVVNKIFTVWDKEQAIKEGIDIQCGKRKCIECLICYKKAKGKKYINELLK